MVVLVVVVIDANRGGTAPPRNHFATNPASRAMKPDPRSSNPFLGDGVDAPGLALAWLTSRGLLAGDQDVTRLGPALDRLQAGSAIG